VSLDGLISDISNGQDAVLFFVISNAGSADWDSDSLASFIFYAMGDVPITGAICNFSSSESNTEPATSNDIVDPSLNGSHVASASWNSFCETKLTRFMQSLPGNETRMLAESPELLQKTSWCI
jgi:hypothetical protein